MKTKFLQLLAAFADVHADLDQKQHQYCEFPCLKHQLAASGAFERAHDILLTIFLEMREDEGLVGDLETLRDAIDAILKEDEAKS